MVFWQLTIDANDPPRLARFWREVLGWQPVPPDGPEPWWDLYRSRLPGAAGFTDRLFDPEGRKPPLWFQQVPEEKAGKNRLHLDVYPTGRDRSLPPAEEERIVDARVAELEALGATVVRRTRDEAYYVVLTDPEGNEFCVG